MSLKPASERDALDVLNAELMCLRLMPAGTARWIEQDWRLYGLLLQSDLLPTSHSRVPTPNDNLRASVSYCLWEAWRGGGLLYFSRKALTWAVENYIRHHYGDGRRRATSDAGWLEAVPVENEPAPDEAAEIRELILSVSGRIPALLVTKPNPANLTRNEIRLLGWILNDLTEGQGVFPAQGWQTCASGDLAWSAATTSRTYASLTVKLQLYFGGGAT